MADTSDFRRGMVIELDGTLYSITYFQHVKPGKGGAFVRTKLKDVMEGGVIDRTFRAGEKVKEVRLERRPIQYTYTDGQLYYFMSMETYEQIPLSGEQIGEDQLQYLQENMECQGLNRDGVVLSVELPQFVELEIVETEPGVRGDTAQGGAKRARLATGAVVQVPLFLEVGDVVRVDRTEGKYITRVT
ncbi:elongation factor P [Candidatus Palauibacter sp.]|uniref:elongation factor P n=1 Tax=Candidatus Palauibacter sp. TaxID=3101350 RepID=UPI003B5ABCEE